MRFRGTYRSLISVITCSHLGSSLSRPRRSRSLVTQKKAAAANVESVFSGAGKFTDEAKSAGPVLTKRMVRLHYNWKYSFLRPSVEGIVKRYKEKFSSKSSPAPAPALA